MSDTVIDAPEKRCTGPCGRVLPATPEFFYRKKHNKDGLDCRCKECDKADQHKGWAAIVKPTACAACGKPITQPERGLRQFCNKDCQREGRAFCKACGKPIERIPGKSGPRRDFCDNNDLCQRRFARIGMLTPTYFEERNRTECLYCGKPITQTGKCIRKFCDRACGQRYRRTGRDKKTLTEDWGVYGPETRKVLREVQQLIGIGAAKRVATAIDREYVRRR